MLPGDSAARTATDREVQEGLTRCQPFAKVLAESLTGILVSAVKQGSDF